MVFLRMSKIIHVGFDPRRNLNSGILNWEVKDASAILVLIHLPLKDYPEYNNKGLACECQNIFGKR